MDALVAKPKAIERLAMQSAEYDPLSRFGLEAIDLRWTLKDIIAKRWLLSPPDPEHLSKLIDLGPVEMGDDKPFATPAGQDVAWL